MSQTAGPSVLPRENPRAWIDKRPEEFPPGWIDQCIRRLFAEWNRQMIRMERASKQRSDKKDHQGNYTDDPGRERDDVVTLGHFLRSLDKLMHMEQERVTDRANCKTAPDPEAAIAALRRRLDKLLEHDEARRASEKSERSTS